MTANRDHLNPDELALTDEQVQERLASVPRKIQKRRQHFIALPWMWFERLKGAHGQTYRVALYLLYLHWKGGGTPIKLTNGMLRIDGVSRYSKWRAVNSLERLGLVEVERRPRRSPLIRLLL
jgi:hypothetical protein